ncbi:MAG: hypothetical protein KTR21_15760, partial [Rhodobacteraceae bacterium]|nr:hypothetical protein [Paracoccaceae bacterium]
MNTNEITFFSRDSREYGTELWVSGGLLAEPMLVKDLHPGLNSSSPFIQTLFGETPEVKSVGGKFLFFATHKNGSVGLWATDGTEEGTELIQLARNTRDILDFTPPEPFGEKLVFQSRNEELWITDGTSLGTFRLPVDRFFTGQFKIIGEAILLDYGFDGIFI